MKRTFIIILFLASGIAAHAQTALQQTAEAMAADPVFSHAVTGIKVMTGAGDVLAEADADRMLVPASNMKLISTGAALFSLGPSYRFGTDIAYDGTISDGTLHGDLYIVGGADPTLGSKDTLATPLTEVFEEWEKAIRSAGIRSIDGKIIGDGRWLEGMSEDPTWLWNDLGTYYGTGVSGLMFYENMMSFSVSPGKTPGSPINIKPYYPSASWMEFRYDCTTGAKGTGDKLYMYTSRFAPVAEIRGTFGVDRGQKRVDCSNKFPEYTCAVYFKNFLEKKGIRCTGGAADFSFRTEWLEGRKPPKLTGPGGDSLKIIGTTYSPTLDRIAFATNHASNNLYAETLLRTLGHENRGSSCYDSSYVALKDVLRKMRVGTASGLNIQDGSGLSRQNLVSADFMCRFLGAMMDSPCFEEFLWSLPYPGGNGSLSYNMKGYDQNLRQRIRVKSGSMNGVRCYSGYILPKDFDFGTFAGRGTLKELPQEIKDRIIIFSVLTGNCVSPQWKVRPMLDRFMAEMAGF